jgi:hypothetical protein
MALVRIIGDRVFETRRGGWEALPVPEPRPGARPSLASTHAPVITEGRRLLEADERPKIYIGETPVGPPTIYSADYAHRLPEYETAARDVYKLPVTRVWDIVHSSQLRAAIVLETNDPPAYTVYLNTLRTRCVVHRLGSFEHELEHARRGDCLKAEGYSERMEQRCNDVGEQHALAAARLAVARESTVSIDAERCRRCSARSEAPCPQGAEVFAAVQRALAPL